MARVYKRPEIPVLMSVSELFARDITLNIPKWQREYSWDADEEVRELLVDLEKFILSKRENYVLGAILTYSLKDGSHAVVDGQQRTLTLFTMLIAIRDLLEFKLTAEYGAVISSPAGLVALYQHIDSLTRKISLDTDAKISIPIYMEYGDGNQILTALAIKSPRPNGVLTVSQTNILNAYDECKQFLDSSCESAAALAEFAKGVSQGTFLIETNVGDQRHALDVFFKMNVRGKSLEGSDYLKNFLFQNLADDQYDDLTETWTGMSKALRNADISRSKLKTPEFFLRNLAIVEKGEKINGELGAYEFWSEKLENNEVALTQFLSGLKDQALVFSKIASNKLMVSNDVNVEMLGADYFKGTQYIPVLLAGSKLKNYNYLSELVNSRYLLYIFSQERTQDFETMVPKWAKAINELPAAASKADIDKATQSIPGLCFDAARLSTLKSKLAELSSPKDERKIRVVLATVALAYESELTPLPELLKKYSARTHKGFDFDLILNVAGIQELDLDSEERAECLGIGNSTLVNGLAKHYASKKPSAKADIYLEDQNALTRALAPASNQGNKALVAAAKEIQKGFEPDLYSWDLDQIRLRREFIISEFISAQPDGLMI
jgi:uncharacterized protein with ParB-like and HNH nuclease domain